MDILMTILRYGALIITAVQAIWIGWALVSLAVEKARTKPAEAPSSQE